MPWHRRCPASAARPPPEASPAAHGAGEIGDIGFQRQPGGQQPGG
jgi:hypothetical protein